MNTDCRVAQRLARTVPIAGVASLSEGASRTHMKNGIMKMANQIAMNGPTERVPSRRSGSSPNNGAVPSKVTPASFSASSNSMMKSDTTPPQ